MKKGNEDRKVYRKTEKQEDENRKIIQKYREMWRKERKTRK